MRYSVPKIWQDATCLVIAGGPSLKDYKHDIRPKVRVITINDSWKLAPFADVHYFCDKSWWDRQLAINPRINISGKNIEDVRSFHDQIYKGNWITISPDFIDHPQVKQLHNFGQKGMSEDPSGLYHGNNSGYQAIQLAYLFGAKRIILLGYDMQVVNGKTHWHNDNPIPANAFQQEIEKSFLPFYGLLADKLQEKGIQVINATPDSALEVFPKMSLKDAIDFQGELTWQPTQP